MKRAGPIVITGFMGCGKSKAARELARRLNVAMVDLDEMITARERRTPAQLITEEGEPAFRAIESDTFDQLLHAGEAGVIALGGGAWIEKRNRDLVEEYGCISVWLDAPLDVCWSRITASTEDRPLGRTIDQAQALYERRRPIYALASIKLEVTGTESVEDLASSIIHSLQSADYTDL
jgi:shikimate kinase